MVVILPTYQSWDDPPSKALSIPEATCGWIHRSTRGFGNVSAALRWCNDPACAWGRQVGWLGNGKWTQNEDVCPIENGDFSASHVSLLVGTLKYPNPSIICIAFCFSIMIYLFIYIYIWFLILHQYVLVALNMIIFGSFQYAFGGCRFVCSMST